MSMKDFEAAFALRQVAAILIEEGFGDEMVDFTDVNVNLTRFTIERNMILSKDIDAFYRYQHFGYHDSRTPKYINMLKNDFSDKNGEELSSFCEDLKSNLENEIYTICNILGWSYESSSICVVPRSKIREYYNKEQLLFLYSIKDVINKNFKKYPGFDGTDSIIRVKNTRTTHLNKSGYGGDGRIPYKGISLATCAFSDNIKDKNILLIDDIYTKTVNVIEDMVQALLDKGARNVAVYTIGYNMYRG
ncbi:amidophosphoribosyltransferase [Avibacterium paragallinarum]|uniref:Amidophosphoribosyltransferase n=4 Tax=Avibacterium paragallinarum TaxID=728 RepID=A0AAE5TI56_AVIPA|nr:amidophosphoribosyltransferase [Avibacterium paragallinarum]MEE3609333.1 hypothetical protein [Avibacterium paragallinarum]MEE3681547.1 hypothetical protein [Avibacterium paragallinarum]MEE4386609.1 hypothetical protein [Avibacterium paragallinarum]PXZ38983.1 amidophosphoribosyltransferase [Avibacterium paragallinarum]PXZ41198.1 amidophosphoribosyltransferase [Avibacterium paragallinarum]